MAATWGALGSDNVARRLVSHWFVPRKAISKVRDIITMYTRGKK